MHERNMLEDLVAVSPGMEIWWDSSPVILDNWYKKMLEKADAADHDVLKAQFARMYDVDDPLHQLFRGVTTNPPLSLQAIQDDPPRWQAVAEQLQKEHDGLDTEGLFWELYKQVVQQGSDMFLPLFEASG
jgi:transaldolase